MRCDDIRHVASVRITSSSFVNAGTAWCLYIRRTYLTTQHHFWVGMERSIIGQHEWRHKQGVDVFAEIVFFSHK
jgi:hypothetical protein